MGSGGGGKQSTDGSGGISGLDFGLIQQALGQGIDMIKNRYSQLGLGVPDPNVFGGDPATAAKAGGSLQFGSPGTAQHMDEFGLGSMAEAALGQLQTQNTTNPAVAGSPANQAFQSNQLSQISSAFNQQQGANAANAANTSGGDTGSPS
jgi:hypothetical protein